MDDIAIKVDGVSKNFKIVHGRNATLKSHFTSVFRKGKKNIETQHTLKNVSFEVNKGEFFGIVGRNGSGKSTLLKMLAGIYQPTKGQIHVHGKLVPFIELGVGFNPELTGKENVYLNGALLGFSKEEVEAFYDEVVEFAELEQFMDKKLKNYSSGMQVRLAFSMAVQAKADILLIDEVLAVGDADFQRKCFNYFKQLKKNKKTVVFVSHDMDAVREFCDRAILIEQGKIVTSGTAREAAKAYTQLFMGEDLSKTKTPQNRWGSKAVTYTSVMVSHATLNSQISLRLETVAKVHEEIENPIFGFMIKNAASQAILGTNTHIEGIGFGECKPGQTIKLTWEIPNIFSDGLHYIDPAIVKQDGITVCDWWEEAGQFVAKNTRHTPYVVSPPVSVKVVK
jgi:ABC-2 type transport system ATP-binding protein